jgi:hypothetical protein
VRKSRRARRDFAEREEALPDPAPFAIQLLHRGHERAPRFDVD